MFRLLSITHTMPIIWCIMRGVYMHSSWDCCVYLVSLSPTHTHTHTVDYTHLAIFSLLSVVFCSSTCTSFSSSLSPSLPPLSLSLSHSPSFFFLGCVTMTTHQRMCGVYVMGIHTHTQRRGRTVCVLLYRYIHYGSPTHSHTHTKFVAACVNCHFQLRQIGN